ncbi:MAG: hypothetical protein LBE91_18665 [Tannerella sp.]|jgi:hypothetical protein|nr:hypothetical protein [Tannerella sp.]
MAVTHVLTQKGNPGNPEVRKDKVKSRRAFGEKAECNDAFCIVGGASIQIWQYKMRTA